MAVPMANGPPFATLNHVAADLGIPNESEPLRVGISDSLSSPTTGEGGNHGCEGDFGKEVCCEAERRGTRTAWNVDSERKEPGAPGAEGADLVEGRCLGSWQRVERQPDHRSSGNQPIHGLSGAQTAGGRSFEAVLSRKPRAMPVVARIFDGEKEAKLIALACSKPPKGRARWTLRLLENKVVELGIVDRASDSTIGRALKKTLFSPIAAGTGSSRRRPTARS